MSTQPNEADGGSANAAEERPRRWSERESEVWERPSTPELQELERELEGALHLSKWCSHDEWTAFQSAECDELTYHLGPEDGNIRQRLIRELRRVAIWHLEFADELEASYIPACRCTGVLTREYRINYYSTDVEPRRVWLCDACAAKGGLV